MKLPPYQFIDTPAAWRQCLQELSQQPRLAIDLEANSLYVYREQICLIQISTSTTDYILDPLAPIEWRELGDIIEDPAVEKIFHSGEYDLILLKRQCGWEVQNLFDTMWAARILGHTHMGLANVLENKFGVKLKKKWQKANWCRRPLLEDQLRYAQNDTHYLLPLRDQLETELKAADSWTEAQEIFAEQCRLEPPDVEFDPEGFWRFYGVRKMTKEQQAVVRELYLFREQEARRRDLPVFRIFGEKTLLALATEMPRTTAELEQIDGLSFKQVRKDGRKLLNAIERALTSDPPARPKRRPRPPADVLRRYDRLKEWRKQRAIQRGVESDVIISRGALWDLALERPATLEALAQIDGIGPWRLDQYGAELVALLNS